MGVGGSGKWYPSSEFIGQVAWLREGGDVQGCANLAHVKYDCSELFSKGISDILKLLSFVKIPVGEEEGLPWKYNLFFSDRGWIGDTDTRKWPLYYEIITAIVFSAFNKWTFQQAAYSLVI